MKRNLEVRRAKLLISTDPILLDLETLCSFLSRAYWADGRSRERIEAPLSESLVFGVYDAGRRIGLARIVTDYATFAWLCDVFIGEAFRGQSIGKWLLATILSHPDLQGLHRFLLATRDAHGLYRQYGFVPLNDPQR